MSSGPRDADKETPAPLGEESARLVEAVLGAFDAYRVPMGGPAAPGQDGTFSESTCAEPTGEHGEESDGEPHMHRETTIGCGCCGCAVPRVCVACPVCRGAAAFQVIEPALLVRLADVAMLVADGLRGAAQRMARPPEDEHPSSRDPGANEGSGS